MKTWSRRLGWPAAVSRLLPDRRWTLWGALVLLVVGLLGTLIWLAARYEASQLQEKLDRDTAEAVTDVRAALVRNMQAMQALHGRGPTPERWVEEARERLREHREWLRLEWRSIDLELLVHAESPYRAPPFERIGRQQSQSDVALACATARKLNGMAYSASYFVPQIDGLGMEVMEACLPLMEAGRITGYVIATYSLPAMLSELIGKHLLRTQEVSFTEPDGTRLAMLGSVRRGVRIFTSQQLLDLPGNTLMLRMDGWRGAPDLFPNVLTALVSTMSIALVAVLVMLSRDIRRRQQAERNLAEALAFRKAMEDSLVTGLRARDLQGRITYVNPAFCEMVGFTAPELLGCMAPMPYWPPEMADEYHQRQAIRLAGHGPPRQGYESVFMRKDGTRFPVLVIEAPLITVLGVQTGWMSAVIDISEQRRVEELSRASQDRLQATARLATVGEMASLLSHELNQPLAAIASYATGSLNLLDSAPPPPAADTTAADLRMAMRRIAEQAERAGQVIKGVHDFVRRRERQREPVAAQALIDAVMPLVGLQARKLGVRVDVQVESTLPAVLCDRTMVEQVLLNLSRNAMQAMDTPDIRERVLTLRVRRAASSESQRWVEFSVTDVGPGIPPEVVERLFTPFYTTKAEGMGLGLSLCRTVVEQHGGLLRHEPNPAGGTIFRFTLPAQGAANGPANPGS